MAGREDYRAAARGIARYLAERQRPDGRFPGPDNYGVASALRLWLAFGTEFSLQIDRAWQRLKEEPPTSHTEFNAYALLECQERLGARPVQALLRRMRFGRRHSANWMLLRSVCRSQPGPLFSPFLAALEARTALARYARRGLICDRPGVRSLAYHAFCGALIAELWRHRRSPWAARAAAKAASFLVPFVLPNGDTLYVGRGQQQIFGYGALVYLFEAAAQMTGHGDFRQLAERVFGWLLRYRREDGSFPLVLREGEPGELWQADARQPGWYTYNRYADYLPFLGLMLLRAAEPDLPLAGNIAPSRPHEDFRVWDEGRYVGVIARPVGAPMNGLAFPYVCVEREPLFPCYGAEEDRSEPGGTPLPYGILPAGRHYAFCKEMRYRLTEDGLFGASRLVRHTRRFDFSPAGFVCRDEIVFRRPCSFAGFVPANFLFRTLRRLSSGEFETWHRGARASLRLNPEGSMHPEAAVTASGPLVALRHTMGEMTVRAGDAVSSELRVSFP